MAQAILGLGSNLGNKNVNIDSAIKAIKNLLGTSLEKISLKYETEPFGVLEKQDVYLNCCVLIETQMSVDVLLGFCLGIEAAMGRRRYYKNGPRTIDIDLLLYDNLKIEKENLVVPHPRIKERAFVMIPLSDILPEKKFFDFEFFMELEKIDCSGIKKQNISNTWDFNE